MEHISNDTVAFSLDPGRIYINLQGAKHGYGCASAEYEPLRNEIAAAAMELVDPADGSKIIQAVFRGEELYHGSCSAAAPDLVLHPADGYDLKGALGKPTLTHRGSVLVGMHTFDDASLYVRGHKIKPGTWSIVDAAPTVLALLGLPVPPSMDGGP